MCSDCSIAHFTLTHKTSTNQPTSRDLSKIRLNLPMNGARVLIESDNNLLDRLKGLVYLAH